MAGKRANGEHP